MQTNNTVTCRALTFCWKILRILILSYLGICAYVYFNQTNLLFHPSPVIERTPDKLGLTYEKVEIGTSDGAKITGWFVHSSIPSENVFLLFHGNSLNMSFFLDRLHFLTRLGYNVLTIDYRGYGESPGRPSEKGTYLDSLAAWDYLTKIKGYSNSRIVVYGHSLGGGVALALCAEKTPSALILENTFTSIPDMAGKVYWYLPAELLCTCKYPNFSNILKIKCPVLIIHSPEDEFIPVEMGEKLYQLAPQPKFFLEIHGSHNQAFLFSWKVYLEGIRKFLENPDGK
ncbi:MAG: alpha/beta hydrolase [Candidatus Wallbacteria bacterium]|nr:alpha/beta hydrolase [Candidatus Wallbacteria bacterium]